MKLKIGDKVMFLNSVGVPSYVTSGDTGVIVNVTERRYLVKMDKVDKTWCADEEDVELIIEKKEAVSMKATITKGTIADYITIGDVTIAVPNGCPIGISYRHGDDTPKAEVGQAIALKRMVEDSKKKGLV